MRVESILSVAQQRMITVQADASLVDAASRLSDTHRALLVVCSGDGAMVGVITKTDVVRQVARCHSAVEKVRVSEVMTQAVTSCRSEDLCMMCWPS
jgi:CBS domain-containing protein